MTPAENQGPGSDQDTAPVTEGGEPQDTAAPAPGGAAPGRHAAEPPAAEPGNAEAGAAGPDGGNGSDTEMTDDLAKAQQDLVELTTDLKRLQAEYVNYKRRVDRDRELVKQNAQYSVLSGLLPVLDDIDRAREHGEVEGGFKAVADSLERIVLGLGLEKFGSPGDEFDPNLHEALMHAHSPDVTTTTCQNIIQAGYRIGERVVRPARVTVVDPEPAGDR